MLHCEVDVIVNVGHHCLLLTVDTLESQSSLSQLCLTLLSTSHHVLHNITMNYTDTQFMHCATTRRLQQLNDSPVTLCGAQVTPVTSVRNLGVTMDSSLNFLSHVNHVASVPTLPNP